MQQTGEENSANSSITDDITPQIFLKWRVILNIESRKDMVRGEETTLQKSSLVFQILAFI